MTSLTKSYHKAKSTTGSIQFSQEAVDHLLFGPLMNRKGALHDFMEGKDCQGYKIQLCCK